MAFSKLHILWEVFEIHYQQHLYYLNMIYRHHASETQTDGQIFLNVIKLNQKKKRSNYLKYVSLYVCD